MHHGAVVSLLSQMESVCEASASTRDSSVSREKTCSRQTFDFDDFTPFHTGLNSLEANLLDESLVVTGRKVDDGNLVCVNAGPPRIPFQLQHDCSTHNQLTLQSTRIRPKPTCSPRSILVEAFRCCRKCVRCAQCRPHSSDLHKR